MVLYRVRTDENDNNEDSDDDEDELNDFSIQQ